MYLLLHVIRFVVVMAHYPFLRLFGYGMSIREALGLTVLAFKGAITLTLGLTIFRLEDLSEPERVKGGLIASVATFLYIIIDSLLVKLIMRSLKLTNNTISSESLLVYVTEQFANNCDGIFSELKNNDDLLLADWD